MTFKKHQICVCKVSLGAVDYPRPCIIVDISPDGTLAILPISTKNYGNAPTFTVDERDPDFKATGLTTTSYIFGAPVRDANPSDIIKIIGELVGNLKVRFVNWIGD